MKKIAIASLMFLAACSHEPPKEDFNYPLKAHDITEGQPTPALKGAAQDLRRSNKFESLGRQVEFNNASAELTNSSKEALDQIAQLMKSDGGSFEKIRIAGYTDASGSASRNLRLSQTRADNVRKYLISKGVPATKLEAIGMGSVTYEDGTYPSDKTRTASDRRVDFEIVQ